MFIIIFLILLFIIQIVMLKETTKDNTYNNWSQLLTTIEVSILIPPLIVAYVFLTKNIEWDWDFLPMFIVGAISFILSIIMLIVSTIKKSTMKNTMKKDDKSNTKSIVIAIIAILALFLVAVMTDYIPRKNTTDNNTSYIYKHENKLIKILK